MSMFWVRIIDIIWPGLGLKRKEVKSVLAGYIGIFI